MINSVLHETIIRDIIDVASDMGDTVDDVKDAMGSLYGKGSISSIAKASSDLVLVFPFMCDSTVSLDTASMTAKAIERQCVTMLRLLFSAFQVSDSKDGFDFISKFHTNIKADSMTLDDFMGYMDKMAESGDIDIVDPEKYNAIKEQMSRMFSEDNLPDDIRESSLNEYSVVERYSNIEVLGEVVKGRDSSGGKFKVKGKVDQSRLLNIGGGIPSSSSSKSTSSARNVSPDVLNNPDKLAQFYKNMADAENNRLIDSDVKKANELMPSMMTVNFVQKNDNGMPIPATFVCGVKCRLIPVDPMDIADRILVKHADNNVLLSFIKATTRETSFIKDFLFAIDRAKIDAISQSRRGSSNKMWKVLERRANKSRIRRAFSKQNDATMITTLGISQELAEYIKKENGIDISNPKVIRPIMENYNLMGVVIIDEAAEADKFLWDTGEGFYETISFNNLEREASGGEYKKALNLMQKMYR